MDQVSEFIDRCVGAVHGLFESIEHLFGFVAEKLYQYVVFVFEVEIDGAIRNPGFSCDLGYRWLMESQIRKYFHGGFEDTFVFIVIFVPIADVRLQISKRKMNECSFNLLGPLNLVK